MGPGREALAGEEGTGEGRGEVWQIQKGGNTETEMRVER